MSTFAFDCVRTSLSNSDHVMTSDDGRNCVGLDGRGHLVATKLDVFNKDGMDSSLSELRIGPSAC